MASTYSPCLQCGALVRISLDAAAKGSPVCGSCKTPLPVHSGVSEVSAAGLQVLLEKCPLPVVVDFWAEWCAPCKMFAPIFLEAARRLSGKVVFARLDTEAEPEAAASFSVRSIPTLIVFKKGEEKGRTSGAMLLEPFVDWLGSVS